MRRFPLLILFVASSAGAQDSSFHTLRVRASVLRLPVIGRLADDWRAKTGAQVDMASDVAGGEIALSVGWMAFDAVNGKPPFSESLYSLGWARPVLQRHLFGVDAGARLTNVRMYFDDPGQVIGLRNEGEQLLATIARGRFALARKYSGFVEASYGVLMTSTRTPTATLAVGLQRDGTMPRWLRDFLR